MKKKSLKIMFILMMLSVVIYIYNIMIKSIENVREDFFNVVCDKKTTGINYGVLQRYDYTKWFEIKTVDNLSLEIDFIWHNFKEGYMDVQYSYDINKDDKHHAVGAFGIESRWYIKKVGDRWIVYDIRENP